MGTPYRLAPAVRLSPQQAEPVGGRKAAEHQGPGHGVQVENRPGSRHRTDLPSGAAGQAAEVAGFGVGSRAGGGWCSGADRGDLGGGATVEYGQRLDEPLKKQ